MTTKSSPFGKTLKALRRERGLSQASLADRLGSTQRHVSFLETGRATPSRYMLQRIERELALPVGRSQVLFEAAGFASPYKHRAEDSHDVVEALDLIETRLLAHWPFPAYVLDKRWTILRTNAPGKLFLAGFTGTQNEPPNLFRIFLSETFRERILNWREAAPIFAARLYKEAAEDPELESLLEEARASGLLDGLDETFREDVPVFVPVEVMAPGGGRLRVTSLLGQLASVQDAVIEGMTIELMVPMDEGTETCLLAAGAQAGLKAAE
ncbi:helix-turn-helix domain-containing protein [Roseibium sediminicola]|uniref:Helix-turn-helix transcriptional regulator n=1 Tax=Roseibium sediminicola TaxID=2933272 RepID=A0ABT0GTI9_9HYPH|nr:helix-turn-helix transcriptional regulator [Roseibium sp. CAU 1639]MCK7612755.1 helix-turn-helix transcriptional regulator [Roseibium sp. CAU 1639]